MIAQSLDRRALHAAYADGLDPRSIVDDVFARLAAVDDPGIFISLAPRETIDAHIARLGTFDPIAKPLWGLPFGIKDNIDVAGLVTTAACPAYGYHAEASAAAVTHLVAAGAIPIGKTNLDQFATGLVGTRSPYPVPRNPFDPAIVPGGSSAGSAVAVARGIVSFALGTDTAGSGRVPAGLNNLVGLKPTLGAVSVRGVVPACRTLDCVSVFALTVDDAWAVYRAMAVADPLDPWSKPVRTGDLAPLAPVVRIGVPGAGSRRFFGDAAAQAAFERSLADLADIGASLVEIDLSVFFEVADLLYGGGWVAERYAAIRGFIETTPEALYPITHQIIAGARKLSAADAFQGFYRLAELRRASETTWRAVDALLVPTLPTPPTLAAVAADPIGPNSRLGTYTNFVNLLDLCAIAVPGRFRADGLPSGVTLIAPAGSDAFIASLGAPLHARAATPLGATTAAQPPMPTRAARAAGDEVEIAVVGAHLSGMPLNHQLTDLGARFLRAAETRPEYRLFALPPPGPPRPGMLRVGEDAGVAIACEVWCLPPAGFGSFVATIAPPLGIGEVQLADGTSPKGFLCEAIATQGAQDISALGSWRLFVQSAAA